MHLNDDDDFDPLMRTMNGKFHFKSVFLCTNQTSFAFLFDALIYNNMSTSI